MYIPSHGHETNQSNAALDGVVAQLLVDPSFPRGYVTSYNPNDPTGEDRTIETPTIGRRLGTWQANPDRHVPRTHGAAELRSAVEIFDDWIPGPPTPTSDVYRPEADRRLQYNRAVDALVDRMTPDNEVPELQLPVGADVSQKDFWELARAAATVNMANRDIDSFKIGARLVSAAGRAQIATREVIYQRSKLNPAVWVQRTDGRTSQDAPGNHSHATIYLLGEPNEDAVAAAMQVLNDAEPAYA